MSHFGMNLKQYALANIEFVTRHFEERLEVDDAAIQLREEKQQFFPQKIWFAVFFSCKNSKK